WPSPQPVRVHSFLSLQGACPHAHQEKSANVDVEHESLRHRDLAGRKTAILMIVHINVGRIAEVAEVINETNDLLPRYARRWRGCRAASVASVGPRSWPRSWPR